MLSGLMSKPQVRAAISDAEKQLKAGDELEVAQKLQAQKKDELAYARFADVVKFFPGTEAAGKAQAQLNRYEQDAAFMKRTTEHAAAGTMLKRAATLSDVAAVAVFAASDQSRALTGTALTLTAGAVVN